MYINYPCIPGRFREYGADVELICEFPRGTNIVSNIVWERVPSSLGDRLVNSAINVIPPPIFVMIEIMLKTENFF